MDEVGVADVGVAVGVGEPRRLEVVEQGLDARLGAELVSVQDVEDLALGRAAARRRRHPVDAQPPVVHPRRREDPRAVGLQILHLHDPRVRDDRLSGREHGVIVGLDDGLSDRPVVQRRRPAAREQFVRVREVGIAQPRPDRERIARRRQQERPARRVGLERRKAGLLELVEVEVDREAALGEADRRLQIVAEREPAELAHGRRPRRDVRRHAGRQRLIGGCRVVHRLAGRRIDEKASKCRPTGRSRGRRSS